MNIGIIYALLASITWGFTYALDEKILNKTSPVYFLFISSLTTSLISLSILLYQKIPLNQLLTQKPNEIGLIIFNCILSALAGLFILLSIKNSTASSASIIEISYPLFVVLFSWLLYKSLPNPGIIIGGVIILIGVFIVAKFA